MLLEVQHWSGAGNRFVILNDQEKRIDQPLSSALVGSLCKRRNLPNAEGLLVLRQLDEKNSSCTYDFYNPDGTSDVMCGNGARCAVRHAAFTHNQDRNNIQLTLSGRLYTAQLVDDDRVALRLPLYEDLRLIDSWTYVNVGSQHVIVDARDLVQSVEEFTKFDLVKFANENLNFYREKVGRQGLCLNIAYLTNDQPTIQLRTYENGVFDETQACGTGAVSTAIAFWTRGIVQNSRIQFIPKSQRLLTVQLDIDSQTGMIAGMILEGDARQDAPANQFNTISMQYQ